MTITLESLGYQLQECQNLEQYFTAAGDKGSTMYFRQRIRELQRKIRKEKP